MKKELVCEKKDDFWFYSIFSYKGAALSKDAIIIDEKDTDKFVAYINKEKIDKVIVDLWNSGIESLSFLKEIDHIKYLDIWGNGVIDNTPIYELNNLKFLGISRPSELYIDRVKGLEFFSTSEVDKIKNIEHATTLKSLRIYDNVNKNHYHNLKFLSNLINLDTLFLGGFNITTLEGIEKLNNLKVLIVEDMKMLKSIYHLTSLSSSLKNLRIYNCNKISDFDVIRVLRELIFLRIDSVKLVLNVEFITDLKKLYSFVSVSSNFIDGNLTPLTRVEHAIVYPIRKHYFINKNNENKKVKDTDFKYGERKMGDEEIELWRRIAY